MGQGTVSGLEKYWRENRKWIISALIGLAGTLTYVLGPDNKWTVIITAVLTAFGVWRVPNDHALTQPVGRHAATSAPDATKSVPDTGDAAPEPG
jgi:hypothetical protein